MHMLNACVEGGGGWLTYTQVRTQNENVIAFCIYYVMFSFAERFYFFTNEVVSICH